MGLTVAGFDSLAVCGANVYRLTVILKRRDNVDIIELIDELIAEAKQEPSWTALQALRCLRKELLAVAE